jgi:hypothetical protein
MSETNLQLIALVLSSVILVGIAASDRGPGASDTAICRTERHREMPADLDRLHQQIFTADELRKLIEAWEKHCFPDQPNPQPQYRTHGGII